MFMVTRGGGKSSKSEQQRKQISLLQLLVSALRKSMVSSCRMDDSEDEEAVFSPVHLHHMEIGWPTNVHHLTHVTFDRFHGFLGLPLELQLQIPSKPPSASVSVCGVSADSLQWSYDARCNTVPTILLLMQEKLYALGGLKAEGIFRIDPENSQEEHVRGELSRGIVPEDIDVHCLAGLIKAWFRELPSGVLDGLSPDEVLHCDTEDEFIELIKQLNPTESCLLGWAIDLMADVVEQEEYNKMNARNIAMVFAPNMTKMLDPLTALMHAVQVMNLLKALIVKKVRERGEAAEGYLPISSRLLSIREKDEEYVDRHESRGPASDDDEDEAQYSSISEGGDEVESLSEVEQCFLRQLDEKENEKDGFRRRLEMILCRDIESPGNGSIFNADSCVSLSNISTSDDEDSRLSSIAFRPREGSKRDYPVYYQQSPLSD